MSVLFSESKFFFRSTQRILLNQNESLCIFLCMDIPKDLITATDARRILGVSPLKMAKLLKEGTLRHFPDPLDERKKLVSRAEVHALKMPKAEAA